MKNTKLPFVILLVGCLVLPPWWSHAQHPRGQGVRIKMENGQELDLYNESHALVIGVSDYNNGWRKLPGTKRDVAEVAAVLERQGFKVTRLLDPAIEDFERAMRNFISTAGLGERNRLVIYFAGHGHTERLNDERDLGYIVMRNAPRPDLDPILFSQAAISMEQVNAWAQRIKSKHTLFVFDSCFSGSIFRSESERRRPARIESKSASPVRQFITSGNAGQEVPDDSIFRRYFVRAFDGEGDLDGDGYLTGEELGIFLSGRVASDTGDTQTPRYGKIRDARLNLGDFIFALPKKAVPPPPMPMPTPALDLVTVELALWQSTQRNDEISDYEEYLRQYPQGRFAVSARNRIARLRAPTTIANPVPANPQAANPVPSAQMSVTGMPPAKEFLAEAMASLVAEWTRAKDYTKEYLDVMPEEGYGLKPTPEIRSFAEQMLHLAGANFTFASRTLNATNPYQGKNLEQMAGMKTKAATSKVVLESYDFVINAIKGLDAAKLNERVNIFNFNMPRSVALAKAFEHQTHHRGQTTIYLRMKGVKPPNERLF